MVTLWGALLPVLRLPPLRGRRAGKTATKQRRNESGWSET